MVRAGKRGNSKRERRAAPRIRSSPGVIPAWVPWVAPAIIALFTIIAFFPALDNGFVDWDDETALLVNSRYRGLGWRELRWMFTTFYMGHYQPLTWLSFAVDFKLWALDPLGYHLTNLVIHAANAVLFYFVALQLFAIAFAAKEMTRSLALYMAAGFAALLFAVHPLRVESVAWVTERRDVLSGVFFFLTLLFYLKAHAGTASTGARRRYLTASLLAYAFSLLSKAAAMTLPFLLVALDVYPLRRLTTRWVGLANRSVWVEKIPFFLLGFGAAFLAFLAQQESRAMLSVAQHGFLSRLAQALYGLMFYLRKTLLPSGLSPIYEIPRELGLWRPDVVLSGLVVSVITVGALVARRRWPAGLAVWVSYVILLAPVLGFFQSGPQLVAERYSYLACLGWALLGGGALYRFWPAPGSSGMPGAGFRLISAVAGALLIVLGVLTWRQTMVWRDSETLWRHSISSGRESSFAHYNLANIMLKRGDVDQAILHYRESLQISPVGADAHYNLGTVLSERGQLEEAMEHFRKALEIDPESSDVHTNLAGVLVRQGKVEEAIEHFREALQIRPGNPWAHFNLASLLAGRGKLDEAAQHYRQVLKANPADAEAHHNLGEVLVKRKDIEEAIAHFRAAIRLKPNFAAAHESLGRALGELGKRDEAIGHYQEALRIMKSQRESLREQ